MGARVMLVDDHRDSLRMLRLSMRRAGYEVDTAMNGLEAIQKLQRNMPDVVVLDIMMPKMDGHSFLKKVRGYPQAKDLPVIVLTGVDTYSNMRKSYDCGTDVFMTKPVKVKELVQTIEELLRYKALLKSGVNVPPPVFGHT